MGCRQCKACSRNVAGHAKVVAEALYDGAAPAHDDSAYGIPEFFDHPLSRPYRVDVFERFVRDFETKLNQLRLVEMGVKVAKEIESTYLILVHFPVC